MSETSFSACSSRQSTATDISDDLDQKLILSAMLFSTLDLQTPLTENNSNENIDPVTLYVRGTTFEEQMEIDGLKSIGGYSLQVSSKPVSWIKC